MSRGGTSAPMLSARTWASRAELYEFPETAQDVLKRTPETGVCFSGGGTRALCATMGQLRGLASSGLLDHVDYISCVSGGSWASTVFTYYASGPSSDAELLGPVTKPQDLSPAGLNELAPTCLGHTATSDFKESLWRHYRDPAVPRDEVWIRAVGEIFLAPFGLYDPHEPAYFTWNEATLAAIRERNSCLDDAPFHTARGTDRPYLVVNSTLLWPTGDLRHENCVGFEYTPLYVGSPYRLRIGYKPPFSPPRYRTVGGGFLEAFAYGGPAPSAGPDASGIVKMPMPVRPFTLADASGTSSSAYARALDDLDPTLSPHANYWPVAGGYGKPAQSFAFGDGGNLENYGLIALLLREVPRIVVFVNTDTKLNIGYSPADPATNPPSIDDIDEYLPPLFGVWCKEHLLFDRAPFPHNRVFRAEDFTAVVTALQEAKRGGGGAVAVTTLPIEPNAWWGVRGAREVTICWVYLDRAAAWEQQLDANLRQDIEDGNRAVAPSGPFEHFPNYATVDERSFDLVELTAAQVNLLADLTCWTVTNNVDRLKRAL